MEDVDDGMVDLEERQITWVDLAVLQVVGEQDLVAVAERLPEARPWTSTGKSPTRLLPT